MLQSIPAGYGRWAGIGLLARAVIPAHGCVSGIHFLHRDAAFHRTDQRAQIAANTFFFDDARHVHAEPIRIFPLRYFVRLNALVCAVLTGYVAELAADAKLGMDLGDDLVV